MIESVPAALSPASEREIGGREMEKMTNIAMCTPLMSHAGGRRGSSLTFKEGWTDPFCQGHRGETEHPKHGNNCFG